MICFIFISYSSYSHGALAYRLNSGIGFNSPLPKITIWVFFYLFFHVNINECLIVLNFNREQISIQTELHSSTASKTVFEFNDLFFFFKINKIICALYTSLRRTVINIVTVLLYLTHLPYQRFFFLFILVRVIKLVILKWDIFNPNQHAMANLVNSSIDV